MLDKKGQLSFEALILVAFVFIGAVFIVSHYMQISDETVALWYAKAGAVQQLNMLDGQYTISGISFKEKNNGEKIEIRVDFEPDATLPANAFDSTVYAIVANTKYFYATIIPV